MIGIELEVEIVVESLLLRIPSDEKMGGVRENNIMNSGWGKSCPVLAKRTWRATRQALSSLSLSKKK